MPTSPQVHGNGNVTPGRRKGTWRLRVPLGKDPATDKYRVASRTVEASSKRGALALLPAYVAEVRAQAQTAVTVAFLLEEWLALCEADLSPTTLYTYRGYIRRDVLPAIGDVPVKDVTARHLDELYQALRAKGMKTGSIHQVHAICRRAFAQGMKWGWLATNPAVMASPPSVRRAHLSPPTPAVVEAMVAQARTEDPALATLVLVAAVTGARRGELCALRWPDVDFATGTVTIGRALIDVAGHVTEKDTKTHAVRSIAVPPVVTEALLEHRRRLLARAATAGVELYPGAFVWPAPTDLGGTNPWRPDLVTGAFRRLCKEMGVKARLHDLRHGSATALLAAGVDVRTVAGRLGHANPSTTLSVYAHWVPAADRTAADILGDLIGPKALNPVVADAGVPCEHIEQKG